MNLIDSSAWIELLSDGPKAAQVEKHLSDWGNVLVCSMVLYEVHRYFLKRRGEEIALKTVIQLQRGAIALMDERVGLRASEFSLKHRLGTADAIVLATAVLYEAKLVTLDNDFRGLPGCLVI